MIGMLWALSSARAEGEGRFVTAEGGALVLTHTEVDATVEAGLAVVEVRQTFENPFDHPVEATYLFPLPADAAVHAMTMTCGARVIEGAILPRAEARSRYDAAAAAGQRAALVVQEQGHRFRQSVASLCPGETVTVSLTYLDPLSFEDGATTLVFPTTVGPLYRPDGTPEPPLTTLPAHAVDVRVRIAEGVPVASLWSDSHAIEITEEDERGVTVWNDALDALPNKDFHLSWTLGGARPQLSAVALPSAEGEDGYLAVTLAPEVLPDLAERRARELLFVIDESCSMIGTPFEIARATVLQALRALGPDDTFDLVRFSSEASALFPAAVPATPANVAAAEAWLGTFDEGGTEMTAGIVRSLTLPRDPERLRLVLFATDGFIGDDRDVLRAVEDHLGDARIFSLGVGSSVNRVLLDGLAAVGRGDALYLLPDTPPEEIVDRFLDRIAHPALTDLALDWGGLDVVEVYPERLPDLFAGQAVRVVARVRGPLHDAELTLTGDAGDESIELRRRLRVDDAARHPGLPAVWARAKIGALTWDARLHGGDPEAEVTAVARAHHLVSPYTSLVATETGPSACGPSQAVIDVPSMVPAGLGAVGTVGVGVGGGGGLGFGGLGTIGTASNSPGSGTGGGTFGARGEGGLGAVGTGAIILGALDRSVLDAVVRRDWSAITDCYDRELAKSPGIGGRVVVRFEIGPDGSVRAASTKSSTLGHAAVEACVVGRFLRMRFPSPAGGGAVTVSYPLTFSPR